MCEARERFGQRRFRRSRIELTVTSISRGSNADITMHRIGITRHRRAIARPHGAPHNDEMTIGETLEDVQILVHDQNRLTFALQSRQAISDLGAQQGRKASVASSRIRRRGLVMSARPIASICCSPPDKVRPISRRRSCSRGKSA